MVHTGDHPVQSPVLLLPMIDLDPGNMSCVHSTLTFICEHSARYNVTPIITFDQPLLWKSLQVIEGQPENSPLHSIVLRLDGFHTETSFIGSIGHLMAGLGLQELLETIYANNAFTHMLTGKAVQRAFRRLLPLDSAVSAMIVSDEFNVKAPCIAPAQDITEMEDESSTALPDQIVHEAETTRSEDTGETTPTDLEAVGNMFDEVLTGKVTVEEACMSQELTRRIERLDVKKQSIQAPSTAKLWRHLMKMMDLLRMFLKGERMGILALRIQAMYDMMPYLAASGHNLYTKCIHVYLQQTHNLHETHPEVSRHFDQGFHVVRRSDRLWVGLSPDLVIEQVLMRSMNTSGCLTRGRGMTETQRLVWLMAHPVCAEVNYAMP